MSQNQDVVVVGGGIVGFATASRMNVKDTQKQALRFHV